MEKRYLILSLSLLLVGVLLAGLFPAAGHAQQAVDGNFVFVNYIGQDLNLDLDDTTYRVPGTGTVPEGGKLVLNLAPGEHKFAASVAGVPVGEAGTFVIQPGEVVGKAARLEKTDAAINREGIVLKEPQDRVSVFDFNPMAAPATPAPVVDTWQPQPAPAGMGSLVWINYNSDELTVDLVGQLYKVPPQAQSIPGRLQVNVAPGTYRFTASVPYGSVNGEVNVTAGEVIGLNVFARPQPEPEYEVGEEAPAPTVDLRLNQEDLAAQVTAQPAAAPAPGTVPAAAPAPAAATPAAPAAGQSDGLLVKNFTGDTLVFTINGQAYFIPAGSEQTLQLPPGQYNYTASLPYVARTGTVSVVPSQGIQLSVATNIEHSVLNVYSVEL